MTGGVPLYERDPAAWQEHLAEGNATQARKRVSADMLICDQAGRILLVDPGYKPLWDLPGGMAEPNEPPPECARREVWEELRLDLSPGRILCMEWVPPHGPWDDLLAFIFDGGVLPPERVAGIQLLDGEPNGFGFFDEAQAASRLSQRAAQRMAAALAARRSGRFAYLQDGCPWGADTGGRP